MPDLQIFILGGNGHLCIFVNILDLFWDMVKLLGVIESFQVLLLRFVRWDQNGITHSLLSQELSEYYSWCSVNDEIFQCC